MAFAVGEIGSAVCAGSMFAVEIVILGSLGRHGTHQAVLELKSPSRILNSDLLPFGASAWLFAGAFNSPLFLSFLLVIFSTQDERLQSLREPEDS